MFTIPEKTQEEKIKDKLVKFNADSVAMLETYKESYYALFESVWSDEHVTPQEMFNLMGNEAWKLFDTANKVVQHIKAIDPLYEPPVPPYEFTINVDGTVTIGGLLNG